VEGRALVGKDFIGGSWGFSPDVGLGLRHLSNGLTDVPGYRTDDYLYLPVGITARTTVASHNALSFNLEYDHLLHGWQKTRDSQLGGGDVPATPTAPPFTIEGFSDISFDQSSGWALRAGAKYQISRHWSVAPQYIHWNVTASPVNYETATYTVNRITAQEQIGAYEPLNRTNEFTVKVGLRF
jgi:opacity protein-like surface antigen